MPQQVAISKLNQKHPDYDQYETSWENIGLLNEAGVRLQQHAERFLLKRMKELFDVYQERVKRISYTNLVGTCVGWYGAALFRRAPEIDIPIKDDFYTQFLLNANNAGVGFVDVWRQAFSNILLYGRTWIMVDTPAPDAEPQSLLDEKEMGLDQPYVLVYDPRQIINWGVDDYGNLDWVLTKSERRSHEFLSDDKPKIVWCYYDRQGYQRYEVDAESADGTVTGVDRMPQQERTFATLVAEGSHALSKFNMCPFRMVQVDPSLWLTNRCYLQLIDYLNQENALMFALLMANLATPIVYTDNDPQFQLSEAGWIKLGKDDKWEWSEPKGTSFIASENRLEALRQEVFRSFYLQAQGRSSSATSMMSSGYSKELDMMPSNDILTSFGDMLRVEMKNILRRVMLAHGDSDKTMLSQVDVRGFRFETKPATESAALTEEVSAAFLSVNQQGIPKTLRKELMKMIGRNALEDSGPKILADMETEIDAMPEPEDVQADQTNQAFATSFQKMNDRMAAKQEIDAVE